MTTHVFKLLPILLISLTAACTANHDTLHSQEGFAYELPERPEVVSYFSRIHTFVRDTERATYNLMYEIRDNTDSIIYDSQKNYYDNYQK